MCELGSLLYFLPAPRRTKARNCNWGQKTGRSNREDFFAMKNWRDDYPSDYFIDLVFCPYK